MESIILVRFGEIFLKKGNRPYFVRLLREALKESCARAGLAEAVEVVGQHGRFLARPRAGAFAAGELERAMQALTRTFGVVSVSPAATVPSTFEELAGAARAMVDRELGRRSVATFKVECSRTWKRFPRKSPEVERELGAAIISDHPLPVRLKGPDLTVGIEIHEECSYLFVRSEAGPGGLPVGSSGRAALLLSGGIDSPVAGWLMAKRGCRLSAVHFHSYPYTSRRSVEKVVALGELLAEWHGPIRLFSIPLAPLQEYLRDEAPGDKLVLLYRRAMVRLAGRAAAEVGAGALISGESLGQVASQTMANLAVIEEAAQLPLLRPLIAMDKSETIELARRIGTYGPSILPHDDCCSLFLPPHPEIRGDINFIRKVEERLVRLGEFEEQAWAGREEQWLGRR